MALAAAEASALAVLVRSRISQLRFVDDKLVLSATAASPWSCRRATSEGENKLRCCSAFKSWLDGTI